MRFGVKCVIALIALVLTSGSVAMAGENLSYTYDVLGRLVAISTSGTVNDGQAVSTSFDPSGNRTNYSVSVAGAGQANLAVGNANATEGGNLVFTVTRSGAVTSAVSVNYATASGSATSGSDFTAASGTLNFAANETSKTITVATIDDALTESTETLTITLSSPSAGAAITTATGTGTILDNDTGWSSSLVVGSQLSCWMYGCDLATGYLSSGAYGSMSNISYNSYTITNLYSLNNLRVSFSMQGTSAAPPNSGWTSIVVPGVGTLNRTAATYTASGNAAWWTWAVSGQATNGTVNIQ